MTWPMDKPFNVLIADRNPHIREFLNRELSNEGYGISVSGDGREVLRMIDSGDPLDLIVLDPDLPFVDGLTILDSIQSGGRSLPVIIHTFVAQLITHPKVQKTAAIIEKTGNNIDSLKQTVADVLRRFYPHRYKAILESQNLKVRFLGQGPPANFPLRGSAGLTGKDSKKN